MKESSLPQKAKLKSKLIGLAVSVVVSALAFGASLAIGALTFSGTNVTGDSTLTVDNAGALSLGNSSATAITIGRSGITVSFPANVSSTGQTTLASVSSTNITASGYGTFPTLNFTTASGTGLSITNATTTNLTVSGISGATQCLQANASGVVSGAGSGCSGASGWTTSGGFVSLATSTNLVGIGATSTAATLFVQSQGAGTTTVQIQGKAGQTANLFNIASSTGTAVFTVSPTGSVSIQPTIDSTRALTILSATGSLVVQVYNTTDAQTLLNSSPLGPSGASNGLYVFGGTGNGAAIELDANTVGSDRRWDIYSDVINEEFGVYSALAGGTIRPFRIRGDNAAGAINSSVLVIDDQTTVSKIGINTSMPSSTLHVTGSTSTIRIGNSGASGCLEMGNSDGSAGINYITVLNGTLTATTTKPAACL